MYSFDIAIEMLDSELIAMDYEAEMESFTNDYGNMSSIAMEGKFTDGLKTIIQKLIQALKNIGQRILGFLSKLRRFFMQKLLKLLSLIKNKKKAATEAYGSEDESEDKKEKLYKFLSADPWCYICVKYNAWQFGQINFNSESGKVSFSEILNNDFDKTLPVLTRDDVEKGIEREFDSGKSSIKDLIEKIDSEWLTEYSKYEIAACKKYEKVYNDQLQRIKSYIHSMERNLSEMESWNDRWNDVPQSKIDDKKKQISAVKDNMKNLALGLSVYDYLTEKKVSVGYRIYSYI